MNDRRRAMLAALMIAAFSCCGCMTITYTSPEGYELKIQRILNDTSFDSVAVTGTDGKTLTISGYKNETIKALELAKDILSTIKPTP